MRSAALSSLLPFTLITACALLDVLACASTALAAWPVDGRALCTAAGPQSSPVIVGDGAGGAIAAWPDYRNGSNYDLYAQHVLASGAVDPTWPVDGRALCTAVDGQMYPVIVSDGAGGAIVAWQDHRSGTDDIYAQHVMSSGAVDPGWLANGVAVCTAVGGQTSPAIVDDGVGGAIVAWHDMRGGVDSDIYAQHLQSNGVVDPGWPVNGRALCTSAQSQYLPKLVSDGAGGAIATWQDLRSGPTYDIYAQHVRASGAVDPGWPVNGRAVCTAAFDQQNPRIISDGAAGAVITWEDIRAGAFDIYAQHVLASGAVDGAWPANGRGVCTSAFQQQSPCIVGDGLGGAIIAWTDTRADPFFQDTTTDIVADHIRAGGTMDPAWGGGSGGIDLCSAVNPQNGPSLVTDGAGGAIIGWVDSRPGSTADVYAQHMRATGVADSTWPHNGRALCTAPDNQFFSGIVSDGSAGAIAVWSDSRSGTQDIYAQSVNPNGVPGPASDPGWTPNGAPVSTASASQLRPSIVSDAHGGAVLFWEDHRDSLVAAASRGDVRTLGPGRARIFSIRLDELGEAADGWAINGEVVANGTQNEVQPDCATDDQSGAITVWTDDRNGNLDIYAQHMTGTGTIASGWPAGGLAVCTAVQGQQSPSVVTDGFGGGIAVWEDGRSGTSVDLYAQRVLPGGSVAWTANGVSISTATGDQNAARITPDGAGGAFIAWTDRRGANADIYALHIDGTGARVSGWPANGLVICNATADQVDPAIAPDGAGGAIVAWTDGRGADLDIYAQRVSGAGVAAWSANGVVVCNAAGVQQHPRITIDGTGGVIIAWEDLRPGGAPPTILSQGIDLYAMRVQSSGVNDPLWSSNGVALCTAAGDQHDAVTISDGAGGAIVSWVDERSGTSDVYAAQIRHDGTLDPRYPANGTPVSTATGQQDMLAITSDGAGGAIVGWTDGRAVIEDIYASHLFGDYSASLTAVHDDRRSSALGFRAPYPNPFARSVTLSFTLPADANVSLEVIDLAGRRVASLARGERFTAGVHTLRWNGTNDRGAMTATGIYFVRCTVAGESSVRRLALLR